MRNKMSLVKLSENQMSEARAGEDAGMCPSGIWCVCWCPRTEQCVWYTNNPPGDEGECDGGMAD
jgi:hypothetical protein